MNFFAKHIKKVLFIAVIASLVIGLWYSYGGSSAAYTQTEFLLNTECTITAYGKGASKAVNAAFNEIAGIHALTDLYSETSDISKINSANAGEAISIDPAVAHIIHTALEISKASDGAFDITIAPVSTLWKFDGKEPLPPKDTDITLKLAAVGYKNIVLDTKANTVTKLISGAKLDLGGAAKGYAADRAVEILKEYGIGAALIDLGGNVSCFGKNPESKTGEWRVGIQIPFAPTGEHDEIITLKNGSVVTSGTYQRNFTFSNELYHHLLDPSSGYPCNQPYDSVTITADNALVADCLSTACFVLGKEKGTELAKKYNADILFQ